MEKPERVRAFKSRGGDALCFPGKEMQTPSLSGIHGEKRAGDVFEKYGFQRVVHLSFVWFVCLDKPARTEIAQAEIPVKDDLALEHVVVEDFHVFDAVSPGRLPEI